MMIIFQVFSFLLLFAVFICASQNFIISKVYGCVSNNHRNLFTIGPEQQQQQTAMTISFTLLLLATCNLQQPGSALRSIEQIRKIDRKKNFHHFFFLHENYYKCRFYFGIPTIYL